MRETREIVGFICIFVNRSAVTHGVRERAGGG